MLLSRPSIMLPLCVTPLLLLAGCATTDGDFPSLSKRPYENTETISERPAPEPIIMSAELDAQSNAMLAKARGGQAAFEASLPTARNSANAARGSAVGSEIWISAHVALSRLDKARADTVAALGEIDRMIATEREKGSSVNIISILAERQASIAQLSDAQTDQIETLTRIIG